MKIWYLEVDHIPVEGWNKYGPAIPWAHGKKDVAVGVCEMTVDWLRVNGFKTKAAAVRAAFRVNDWDNPSWKHSPPRVTCAEVPDRNLRYKIYRCYEIVILDSEGNAVKESDYCYTTRADAEKLARHEIEILEMNS